MLREGDNCDRKYRKGTFFLRDNGRAEPRVSQGQRHTQRERQTDITADEKMLIEEQAWCLRRTSTVLDGKRAGNGGTEEQLCLGRGKRVGWEAGKHTGCRNVEKE